MELTEDNIRTLSQYLSQTLSPDINVRRPAEMFLESVEVNHNYPLLLLHLIDKQDMDVTIRVAGSVAFKNYIKRNWPVAEGGEDRIHADDRIAVKTLIVDLMLKSPDLVQKQLSDAISTIGKHDFPVKWPGLMDQMVEKFSSGDFHAINGILRTAHSLFRKYRHEFKSQTLWEEIKFVLDKFAKPLTDLFEATMGLLKVVPDAESLKMICGSLNMICKIFYSLNSQDLPEFFEDNMAIWMPHFLTLLGLDMTQLQTTGDEAGVLELVKGQVCDNIAMYAQKYDEEFAPYLANFVTAVWTLLITTSTQPKYDNLVSNALSFLSHVAERQHELFKEPSLLSEICNKVVIPNMEFRATDEELFEDNPEEYIRRDIEGSDVDTRRRAACDLVRALSTHYEHSMVTIFGEYVQAMLAQYATNPGQQWKSKDAACYLVTSLVSKGQTEKHGVTQISQLVNLAEFANSHIFTELSRDEVNSLPVLKADAIKYVMVFRSVLPAGVVVSAIPQLIRHLTSDSVVVYTYAAATIDKILMLRSAENQLLVSSDSLASLAGQLLTNLFKVLTLPEAQENEYVMKTIMRSFSTLQAAVIPFLGDLLPKITNILVLVAKNPSKPHFNHYLFETLSLSVKILCKQCPNAVSDFENVLFPVFQTILQQDVQEFIPYVFQLLSLLLELRTAHMGGQKAEMPQVYAEMLPCLLAPVLWDRPGNVKPLVRLLQAATCLVGEDIAHNNRLSGLLGVFQKLIASKLNDHEGFYLLQHLIQFLPKSMLEPYMKHVFVLIFTRLQSSKTTKLIRGVIVFFCFFASRYSGLELIQLIDSIQPSMFAMVLERIIIQDVQKVSGLIEKKIAAIGIIKLLCETPPVLDGQYSQYWVPLLRAVISLFELPDDTTVLPDDHFIEVDDTPGYSPAYSQLAHAQQPRRDPLNEITDPRLYLAQSLSNLSTKHPGRVTPLVSTLLEAERLHLNQYLTAASVHLS